MFADGFFADGFFADWFFEEFESSQPDAPGHGHASGGRRIYSSAHTVRARYRRDDELIWMHGGGR